MTNEDDIEEIAEIVIDNDVYDEDLIEMTMEHEESIRPSNISPKKSKQSSIVQANTKINSKVPTRNTNRKKHNLEVIPEPDTNIALRRSGRVRRPNINYTED